MFVCMYRIGESRSHEQVAPVGFGELYFHKELFHASPVQLEHGETNTL
jgi:hypothetical protein